ncbi:MAG: hypothetical protein U9N36_11440 [Euryarchaeota archaeon]|nr:hypothetical protein [Euryarchaeota archaeon]
MKFPYQKEQSRLFGNICRPVAEFEVKTELGWTSVLAYIDSGADITLLPMSFITALDIHIEEEDIKDIRGIGDGKLPIIVNRVRMRLAGKTFDTEVAIALIEDVPFLLGREGVFDQFEICFRKNRTIRFEDA